MRNTARYAALAAAGLLALSSLTACANDAASTASGSKGDGKGTKVKIMVGGLDKVIYLPAMLTQRLGYFDA
jgi:NitT/TauT family transport system substrate-binding protein